MKKRFWLIFVSLVLFIEIAYSGNINVGVSPEYLDLGEIKPGNSKIARFYIASTSDELFVVDLGPSKGSDAFFKREKYKEFIEFYSEEDISLWISLLENPIKLASADENIGKTKSGVSIKGMKEATFILKVPNNAEPGYHTGYIHLSPRYLPDSKSTISLMSIVPMSFIFKVDGNAVRSGEILDVVNKGDVEGRLWLKVFFKNNGTVTETIDKGNIEIYNNNVLIGTTTTSRGIVKPNEIKELDSFLDYKYLKEGSYKAKVKVSFVTGETNWEGDITISKKPEIVSPKVVETGGSSKPWKTIIILLSIIAIVYIILKVR